MLTLFNPGRDFIVVSITGQHCDLMCGHCKARFLRHMKPAPNQEALYKIALEAEKAGCAGMLISGGSDKAGRVPYKKYLNIIKKIKNDTGLRINLHTGFVRGADLAGLEVADVISFDVVGSPAAVQAVYGLGLAPSYFEDILRAFEDAGLNVVPHITAGLDKGKDSGEERALGIIARHRFKMVIINSLMPQPGTKPKGHRLLPVLEMAGRILPGHMKIGVGCMRPRCIQLPVDRLDELRLSYVAAPSSSFKKELETRKTRFAERSGCCALASLDL